MGAVAAAGAIYITPVVAILIGWAAGERFGPVELFAVGLIVGSIATLEAGRQRTVPTQGVSTPASPSFD